MAHTTLDVHLARTLTEAECASKILSGILRGLLRKPTLSCSVLKVLEIDFFNTKHS